MRDRTSRRDRGILLGCTLLAGVVASHAEEPKKSPPPPAVSIEVVAPGLFVQRLALTGTVEPATIAELSSPAERARSMAAGYARGIRWRPGRRFSASVERPR
jgi:hypothetical protein